ncbi:MAG: hypothetical protein RR058_06840, partial [Oscillospiraceae bacterium]
KVSGQATAQRWVLTFFETVDGPYALNKCLHGNHECTMDDSEACCFREVYADISRTITQKPEAVSFAQLLMKK